MAPLYDLCTLRIVQADLFFLRANVAVQVCQSSFVPSTSCMTSSKKERSGLTKRVSQKRVSSPQKWPRARRSVHSCEFDLLHLTKSDDQGLPYHVQCASNTAKLAVVRIGSVPNKYWEDHAMTFKELIERVEKTISFLKDVDPQVFEGKENFDVELQTSRGPLKMTSLR
jgi:UDP-N-acetylmuramoylalanine-D-glutamate ligase